MFSCSAAKRNRPESNCSSLSDLFVSTLIGVPIRRRQHPRDGLRIVIRHSRLKQIAHRIDKHQLGRPPGKRLRQLLRHQPQIKPLLIRMPLDPAKPLSKRLGVAVLATRANLDTATDGVPGCVGPFDMRIEAHRDFPCTVLFWSYPPTLPRLAIILSVSPSFPPAKLSS